MYHIPPADTIRKKNCCLNGFASKYPVIANQSADWCGNPPVSGEMYRIAPKKWESPRFLAVIVTWFLSTGGLPRQCAHWLAMTASIRQTPICRFLSLPDRHIAFLHPTAFFSRLQAPFPPPLHDAFEAPGFSSGASAFRLGAQRNWCLKVRIPDYLSLRTSAHTGVAIPRPHGTR